MSRRTYAKTRPMQVVDHAPVLFLALTLVTLVVLVLGLGLPV